MIRLILALLFLLPSIASADSYVWGTGTGTYTYYAGTFRSNNATLDSATWASPQCLPTFWSGGISTGVACNATKGSNGASTIGIGRDLTITEFRLTMLYDIGDIDGGCDIRLTADNGVTGLAGTTLSIPEVNGTDQLAGTVVSSGPISVDMDAGTSFEINVKRGSNSVDGVSTPSCLGNHVIAWVEIEVRNR